MTVILIVIIAWLLVTVILEAILLKRSDNIIKSYREKLEHYIYNIVLNEDLITGSISTLCAAYDIEEGDLKDFIAKKGRN